MFWNRKTILLALPFVLGLVCTNAVFGVVVLERRISASTDDAEEALTPGYTNWNYSSDLEIVHDRIDNGGIQLVGMTFRDINIAPGEIMSSAYIEFVCDEIINGTADAYFLIWGHLTENSEGFVEPYLISDRPKTEAKVPWEPDPWNTVRDKIQTVNIAPIIHELINQEGWVYGNAVEIIIGADPDKPAFPGVRCAESYDGSPPNAPLLHIEIAVPHATEPEPIDGAILEDTWVSLMWSPGISAVSHDVYLGDTFDDVNNGVDVTFQGNQTFTFFSAGFPGFAYPDGLVPGTTYYWRVDEIEADGTVVVGEVWSFMVSPKTAYNPSPLDGGMYVDQNGQLGWAPGLGARTHTVYFGDNFDDVNNASGGTPQAATTYTPGTLEIDKTYYWRVDEFDMMDTHKGEVWSFNTIPVISVSDPNLVGWWSLDEGQGTVAVDWSGYNRHGYFLGDPQWVPGQDGGALEFDGYGDIIEVRGYKGVTGTHSRTSCAWFKTKATGEIMSWGDNGSNGRKWILRVQTSNGVIRVAVRNGYIEGDTDVRDGLWHHVAAVLEDDGSPNATEIKLYLDGALQGISAQLYRPIDTASTSNVRIGESPWHNLPFTGQIADVRIYDVALSAEEVAALAQ